jgi:hypothetical protein
LGHILQQLLPYYPYGGQCRIIKRVSFTTLIGITLGVLVTRPAFADLIKSFEE